MAHINLGKEWTKYNSTTVVVGGVIIVIRYQFLLHFLLQQGQLGTFCMDMLMLQYSVLRAT